MSKQPLNEYFCLECGYNRPLNKMCNHINSSKVIHIEKIRSAIEWLKKEIKKDCILCNEDKEWCNDCIKEIKRIDGAFPDLKKDKEDDNDGLEKTRS